MKTAINHADLADLDKMVNSLADLSVVLNYETKKGHDYCLKVSKLLVSLSKIINELHGLLPQPKYDIKPKVGDRYTAYFGGYLQTATVVEWRKNKCFFDNSWYLIWGGDATGFLF